MAEMLNEKIGEMTYDNLIASVYPEADVFTVTLKAGQGTLKRGTLLAAGDDGMEMISKSTTGKANAVLCDPVDTDGDTAVNAVAYRTGHFNKNMLIVADGYTITDADKEALRVAGIMLSDAVII